MGRGGRLAGWWRRDPLLAAVSTVTMVVVVAVVASVGVLVQSVATAPDRADHTAADGRPVSASVPGARGESREPQDVGTITGLVTDSDGRPVSGADVTVLTAPFEPWYTGPGKPAMPAGPTWEASTGEDGRYEIDGVTAGAHRVRFATWHPRRYVVQFNGQAPSLELAADVEVEVDAVAEVDARLERAGRILGTVRPVEGRRLDRAATVTAHLRVGDSWVAVATVPVGPRGGYRLGRLAAGRYRVSVADRRTGVVHHPAAARPREATPVALGAGEQVRGIDVTVPEPGRLAGRVLEADGTPVEGAEVHVFHGVLDGGRYGGALVQGHQQARTDATGRYELRAPSGRYGLWVGPSVFPAGCTSRWPVLREVPIWAGEETRRDVRRQRPSIIAGRVTDDRGRPLAGVKVGVEPVEDAAGCAAGSRTDERGRYRLTGVRPGRYSFRASSRGHLYPEADDPDAAPEIRTRPGSRHLGVDTVLVEGGRIVGRVDVRGRTGVARIDVTAVETSSTDGTWAEGVAQVREDGRYRIVGLPAGSYRLHFSPWLGGSGTDQSELVHLTPAGTSRDVGAAEELEVSLARTLRLPDTLLDLTGRITGRVTDADDRPRPQIQVAAYRRDEAGEWQEVASTWTDGSGRYTLRNLGGTYRIGFAGLHEFFPDVADVEDADDLEVDPGQAVRGVDAELHFDWD